MPGSQGTSILAQDLRLVRQARGLSLADVAEQVGLDPSALSRLERGQRPLTPDLEIRLLRLFFGQRSPERAP
jgi:transcriptional regulator with XRE-family HTH domain